VAALASDDGPIFSRVAKLVDALKCSIPEGTQNAERKKEALSLARELTPGNEVRRGMTEPREVELWPCGYSAECSVPWCRRRATTILRYLDAQERPYRQTDVCGTHARELCVGMRVIDRRRRSE
jgi:hypothetical protein